MQNNNIYVRPCSALTLRIIDSNQKEQRKSFEKNSHRWKQNEYSPTTSKSLEAMSVWNDGASADTSQLYFPETDGCTWASDTWLSFDPERCNETETKRKQFYTQKNSLLKWKSMRKKNSTTKTPNTKPIQLRIHKMCMNGLLEYSFLWSLIRSDYEYNSKHKVGTNNKHLACNSIVNGNNLHF